MKNLYRNSPPISSGGISGLQKGAWLLLWAICLAGWQSVFAQYPQTKRFTYCSTTPPSYPNVPQNCGGGRVVVGSIDLTGSGLPNLSTTGYRLTNVKINMTNTWNTVNLYLRTPAQSGTPQYREAQLIDHGNNFPSSYSWQGALYGSSPISNCSNPNFATFDIDAPNTAPANQRPYTGVYKPVGDFISNFAAPGNVNPNGRWDILACNWAALYGYFGNGRTYYIQLTFSEPPRCPNPKNFQVDYVLHNSAGVSWTSSNNSFYQLKYGAPGFDPDNSGTQLRAATTAGVMRVEITGLSPLTNYEVYVREECGTNWIGPISFQTECAPILAKSHEDSLQTFEVSKTNLPTCWKRYSNNAGYYQWFFGRTTQFGNFYAPAFDNTTGSGHFASQIDFNWDNNSPNDPAITLETRLYDVTGINKLRVAFWHALVEAYNGASYYEPTLIRVDFFDGKKWNNGVYSTRKLVTAWTEIELDISRFTISGPVKVRWVLDTRGSSASTYAYGHTQGVDDVSFREAPRCPNPTNLRADNVLDTRADIFWTSANADSLSPKNRFMLLYGPSVNNYTDTIRGTLTKGNNGVQRVTITGLQPNTTYCYAVMDLCGSYLIPGPTCFRTLCAAVPAPLLSQGGNLNNFGVVPTCFVNFNPNRTTPNVVWQFLTGVGFTNYGGPRFDATGNQYFATPTPPTGGDGQTLQTRLVNISGLNKPIMSFKVSSHLATATFRVDLFDGDNWRTGIYNYTGGINTGDGTMNGLTRWVDTEVNLIKYNLDKNKPIMARFVANSSSVQFYHRIGVDDIDIKEAGPCNRPFALTTLGVSLDQAVVSWQHTRGPSFLGYEVRYRREGATVWEDTVFFTRTLAVIFGLQSGTRYEWQVRADCDGRGLSNWSDSQYFTTYRTGSVCEFPQVIKSLPYVLNNQNTARFGNDYSPIDACESPYMGGEDYVFSYSPNKDIVVRVTLSNTTNKAAVFITEGCPDLTTSTCVAFDTSAAPKISQVLLRKGKEYYIIVDNKPTPDTAKFDIRVEELKCPEPIDIKITNITNTSALIKWTPLSVTRNKWNVSVVKCGQPRGSGVDVNKAEYAVSALDANTCYDFYLQEDCGNGDKSVVVGPISFYTLRNPLPNPTGCQTISVEDNNCDNRNLIPISVTGRPGNLGEAAVLKSIKVIIQHNDVSELSMSLISPSGKEVALVDRTKVSGINYGGNPINCPTITATFDGSSNNTIPASAPYTGTYAPAGDFADFNDGTPANGLWKLKLCDNKAGNTPTFRYAELNFGDAPKISVANVNVQENVNSGVGVFSLKLSQAVDFRVSVDYELKGLTAKSGVDFLAAKGKAVFQPNITQVDINVPIIDDFLNEKDETLKIVLSNPVNATLAVDSAVMTIIDNDPQPSISVTDVFVAENEPVASFTINLSEISGRDIEFFAYTRDATGIGVFKATGGVRGQAGVDYVALSQSKRFTIPAGTIGKLDIQIQDDFRDEFDEKFELVITKLDGAVLAGGDSVGVCTIFDDDNPPYVVVSNAQALESDPKGIVFRATLTQPSDKNISVKISTKDITAISTGSSADYIPITNQVITFAPDQRVANFTVLLKDDPIEEPWETFSVNLSDPKDVIIPAGASAIGTIINDDLPPIALNDFYEAEEDKLLVVPASSGVLANDLSGSASSRKVAFVVSQPLNGSVILDTTGAFTYLSAPNYNGRDFFTYRVFDGVNTSVEAVVTINVKPVSDAPFFLQRIRDTVLCAGTPLTFRLNDIVADIDDDVRDFDFKFSYRLVDVVGPITQNDLQVDYNPATHIITFTGLNRLTGDFVIEIRATDPSAKFATDVFKFKSLATPTADLTFLKPACENTEFDIKVDALIDGKGTDIDSVFVDYLTTNGMAGTDGVYDLITTSPTSVITYPKTSAGTYPLAYKIVSKVGCGVAQATKEIKVHQFPQSRIYQVGAQLTASEGVSYRWYYNGQPIPDSLRGNRQIFNADRYGDYRVEITGEGGCVTFSQLLILTPAGGLEDVSDNLVLYPNPVTDGMLKLTLKSNLSGNVRIEITDNAGSMVRAYQLGEVKGQLEHVLDVSKLSSGMYHLKVIDSKSVANRKFIKQ